MDFHTCLTALSLKVWLLIVVVVAWLAFGTNFIPNDWSWRIPALIQALPSFIQIAFIYWVPESPRFLIAKDRNEEALAILAKYHANGDVNNATVQFEYREIRETIRLEIDSKKNSSYLDFFRTKGNRYRLIILISLGIFSQWSGNAIISNYASVLYGQAGITDSTAKLGLSAGQTVLSLIVSISMALCVDKFGRRPLFLIATGGMFGTFIFWTLTCGLYEEHNLPGSNTGMIFFIWLFGVFYSVAWSGLLVGYAIEILPYGLRAKGLMILNICIQAALTLNNYANPVAFDFFVGHTWKFYLIYVVSIASLIIRVLLAGLITLRSAGSSWSCASSTSCTSRPRARRSRSCPRSSTATTQMSRTLTSTRSRRRRSSPPSTTRLWCPSSKFSVLCDAY